MAAQITRFGAIGAHVKLFQQALNRKLGGAVGRLKEDGIFGLRTRAAVVRFQNDEELVVDGVIGPCTYAALLDLEKYNIRHHITLVPQLTNSQCWLASTSMLMGRSIPAASIPSELLAPGGGLRNDSDLLRPENTTKFAQHFKLKIYYPQSWEPGGLANVITSGPVAAHILWNISGYLTGTGSSGHFAVIAGIRGDGTSLGTTLRIYDPWPVGIGKISSVCYHDLIENTPGYSYQLFQRQ